VHTITYRIDAVVADLRDILTDKCPPDTSTSIAVAQRAPLYEFRCLDVDAEWMPMLDRFGQHIDALSSC